MPTPITREFVTYRGVKYFREQFTSGLEYFRSSRGNGGKLLHRVLYEEAHGPIPDGWHVHHRDHDTLNNDLANLVAVSPTDHKREHGAAGAAMWDAEERSEARRREWAARKPRDLTCDECGAGFQSTGQRAAFCSRTCQRRNARGRGLNA